ncbi:MAG: SpaA isopeptide-forming pilin-related protein [[Ruminococcus] torques]
MDCFRPDTEEFTEENALLTVTTGEDGSFAFENIPYGHWIVKEISSPALYTVSQQQHHIYIGVDGQRIEIKVENTLIRGSVQVMKTEAVDEPSSVKKEDKDNNTFLRFLSGAVFDLYEDANGNKELDSEDTKIGTLKESDAGYHTAEGLLAKGGYFVKESKAPEGYQLDENAYYFAITEDGQVAVVENGEAGRGFTNEAYRGNLKITKDSSDGRKDGFAFEVKSADGSYCETFTTPKSGVIEVTGLARWHLYRNGNLQPGKQGLYHS